MFLGEASNVKELTRTKYWMNLDKELTDEEKKDYVPYVLEMGKNKKGHLKAISWQSTPGGFFYRRSYAKKYLGTSDPKKVAQAISSWDKFISLSKKINKESKGSVKIVASSYDLFYPFKAARKKGYVVDNKFYLDPQLIEWMKQFRTLYSQNLTAKGKLWTPAWFNGMKKGVLGYFLPTWGLYYVLKPNAPKTSGDWAVTSPTIPFFWGGTWLGVYYKTKHKKEALNFNKNASFR